MIASLYATVFFCTLQLYECEFMNVIQTYYILTTDTENSRKNKSTLKYSPNYLTLSSS